MPRNNRVFFKISIAVCCCLSFAYGQAQTKPTNSKIMTNNKPIDIQWPAEYSPQNTPILVTNELFMNAPAERVFALIADAEKWPKFYFNASNVKITTPGEAKLSKGTKFTWKTFGFNLKSEVIEFVPNERIGWVGHGFGMTGYHAFAIKKIDATHCYVLTEETQSGMVARIGKIIYPTRMEKYHQIWLEDLEKEAKKNSEKSQ